MISSVFRKTGKIKNPHSGNFPFLHGSSAEETKGISTHHDLLCPQRKKALSQDDRHSFFRSTKQDHSQTRRSIRIQAATDSPYYPYLLRSPWSDIRLTTISAMSYMPYFIAFTHAFPCTFCVHFFRNLRFQQIIVVICSFPLLLFLE